MVADSNNDDDNGGSVVVSATCKTFHVAVDNNYKATEFKFFSAKRPHMRTFYIALGKNCFVYIWKIFYILPYHLKNITLLSMKPPVTMFVGMWIWTSVAPLQIAIENTTSITQIVSSKQHRRAVSWVSFSYCVQLAQLQLVQYKSNLSFIVIMYIIHLFYN